MWFCLEAFFCFAGQIPGISEIYSKEVTEAQSPPLTTARWGQDGAQLSVSPQEPACSTTSRLSSVKSGQALPFELCSQERVIQIFIRSM